MLPDLAWREDMDRLEVYPDTHIFKRPSADAAAQGGVKIGFLIKSGFNLVWVGFEVGFGISVKNNADP